MQGTYLLTLFRSCVRRSLCAWLGCRLSRRLGCCLRSRLCRRLNSGFGRGLGRWFCARSLGDLGWGFHRRLGRSLSGWFGASFRSGLGRSLGKTHSNTTDEENTNADLVTHLRIYEQSTQYFSSTFLEKISDRVDGIVLAPYQRMETNVVLV